ncbi:hypothetical protein [Hymenobacter sediminis]|uniref:hypothetical protein n=1 Tax=Hymenobacter sediminis TaxID=2218621 RepID=UPI001EE4CED2|nr:hypothetical protein [Hymenobacter sediminis]
MKSEGEVDGAEKIMPYYPKNVCEDYKTGNVGVMFRLPSLGCKVAGYVLPDDDGNARKLCRQL